VEPVGRGTQPGHGNLAHMSKLRQSRYRAERFGGNGAPGTLPGDFGSAGEIASQACRPGRMFSSARDFASRQIAAQNILDRHRNRACQRGAVAGALEPFRAV